MRDSTPQFGRGLNSLRVRFTLMIAMCVAVGSALIIAWDEQAGQLFPAHRLGATVFVGACLSVLAGALIYLMTGKLTRPIENLRSSTLAIARGDYNTAVQVECNCEVGGLADSFKEMVKRLNANVSRIQTLAYEDGVTGLPNRSVLFEALHKMNSCGGALFFLDLDNFKQINDLYGHQIGDEMLRAAATRIQERGLLVQPAGVNDCLVRLAGETPIEGSCRMLFRFAGDEFVALVGGATSRDELADIGGRIVQCLADPFEIEGFSLSIGCSLGIAVLGEDTERAEELTKLADLAMYAAKSLGKGNFCFYDEGMLTASVARAQLEADLVLAFQRNEFCLHFQPKFAVGSGAFAGVEALVRWQHPTRGLLPPGEFITLAEEKKMLEMLGYEVFRIAAEQAKQWQDRGLDIPISVNVCPTQFLDPQFSSRMAAICDEWATDPRMFTLEITETAAMSDEQLVHDQLHALQAMGFLISVDDFGVGYSNLSKLYKLPFQDLKLDKSMIDDITTDLAARRVLEYTISMAHGLGHPVIAEGVERAEQLEVLAEIGCDYVQGFLLSRPVTAELLDRFFTEDRRFHAA